MPWNDGPNGGFTTGTPWLDAHPDAATINAAAQVDDPDSVFSHYRRLIVLRHEEKAVSHGTFTMLVPDDERIYAYVRELDGTRLLVVANLSDEDGVTADVGPWESAELVVGSVAGTSPRANEPLAPWESRVYRA
jgi:oligo-1,6-glucosidase